MNDLTDFELYQRVLKLLNLFEKAKQVTWTIRQTKERYPTPEAMTKQELESLYRFYLAIGLDLQDVVEEWKELYNEYSKEDKKNESK